MIDLGGEDIASSEYAHLGRVTEFRYSRDLGRAFRRRFPVSVLSQFASLSWQWLPSDRALVFVDNHDNQRGHGAGHNITITSFSLIYIIPPTERPTKPKIGTMGAHHTGTP